MFNNFVSIIIPTLNSEQVLEKCLVSIRDNKSRYNYEIIVVDAGSTDATQEIANRYTCGFLKGLPKRMNRNLGIENARGDIICFTDSDCTVPEDWIDGLVDGILRLNKKDGTIVSVGGGNEAMLTDSASEEEKAVALTMRSPLVAFGARNVTNYENEKRVQHNPTMNSAYLKWAILEGGGFREEPYSFPEEIDLDAKLAKKGYKAYYIPSPRVLHRHRTTAKGFYAQMEHYGRCRLRIDKVHPEIFQFFHLGPLMLFLMIYSPLFFIPFGMALVNALYVTRKETAKQLFGHIFKLTIGFYRSYGLGEASILFGSKR